MIVPAVAEPPQLEALRQDLLLQPLPEMRKAIQLLACKYVIVRNADLG